jgi:hypothetical protein
MALYEAAEKDYFEDAGDIEQGDIDILESIEQANLSKKALLEVPTSHVTSSSIGEKKEATPLVLMPELAELRRNKSKVCTGWLYLAMEARLLRIVSIFAHLQLYYKWRLCPCVCLWLRGGGVSGVRASSCTSSANLAY